jgi:cytidylate kinase
LSKPSTIAIDGPAAAGKSTIGWELANRLEYLFLDTGVMYRAVTWAALVEGLEITDEAAISALAGRLQIDIQPPTVEDGRQNTVLVDDQDITWAIRRADVEAGVSPVSAYSGVRKAMVKQQRRIGTRGRVVMVGRDIGTIVLPGADLKLYLDAQTHARAARRHRELVKRGEEADYAKVLTSMARRDDIDSKRKISPLQPAADAIIIDTSDLTADQVLRMVERLICERAT